MGFKKVLQRLLALLILGGALVFGMSGVYHEAPWILAPLFGSVKVELGGKRVSATADQVKAVIGKRDLKQLEYLSSIDMLTSCKNRNAMNNLVSDIIDGKKLMPESYAVVFADLNGLKRIND